jgi:predicted nucleic acid-binding protein
MSTYVVDTSALLTYIESEAGAPIVEQLLLEAIEGQHTLYMSIVSGIEVFYISLREQGDTVASERLQLLKNLPVSQEPIQEDLLRVIGELKANHQLSFADCCIAGLAKQKAAILLHKDPEFEQLEHEIVQQQLPYKPKTA